MTEFPGTGNGKRPFIFNMICLLGLAGAVLLLALLFTKLPGRVAPWYPGYLGFVSAGMAVGTAGIWLLRKWGLYLYLAVAIINQAVMITMGTWVVLTLVLPGIVAFFAWQNIDRMR